MAKRKQTQEAQAKRTAADEGPSPESGPTRPDGGSGPVNRRRALALGAAAAAAALAGGVHQPQQALAATNDPLKIGVANLGESNTLLDSDVATTDIMFTVGLRTPGSAYPMIEGYNHGSGQGVVGVSATGDGVYGWNLGPTASDVAGVFGVSVYNPGVYGKSDDNPGVYGKSANNAGLYGTSYYGAGVYGVSPSNAGVYGNSAGPTRADAAGVYSIIANNPGVVGQSAHQSGVFGQSDAPGADSVAGIYGASASNPGVLGTSTDNNDVLGSVNNAADGVRGENAGSGCGVEGVNTGSGDGVCGEASGAGAGVHATNAGNRPALLVDGPAVFNGSLQFAGVGFATLPPHASEVAVSNSTVTPQSVVLLTLQGTSRPNEPLHAPAPYWVTVAPGSFTIHYGGQSADPLTFGYLVLSA